MLHNSLGSNEKVNAHACNHIYERAGIGGTHGGGGSRGDGILPWRIGEVMVPLLLRKASLL